MDLEKILQMPEEFERDQQLIYFAEHKVDKFPDEATAIERAVAALWRASLEITGRGWIDTIYYDPLGDHWRSFIFGLRELGHTDIATDLEWANQEYWESVKDIDWDDLPVSNDPVTPQHAATQKRMKDIENASFSIIEGLGLEVHKLIRRELSDFTAPTNR